MELSEDVIVDASVDVSVVESVDLSVSSKTGSIRSSRVSASGFAASSETSVGSKMAVSSSSIYS